jgi:hypothetical protein|tara:strand:+ start:2548 stop:3003 length:456 start_codon:yes stop_codon:yes gene_type:complete
MKKFAMVNQTSGEVEYIVSPASATTYVEGSMYGDHLAKEIDAGEPNDEFLATKYYRDGWQTRDVRPSNSHVWTDDSWSIPTLSVQDLWSAIRLMRDTELAMSDWTQFADSPLPESERGEWAVYREALRDVPANNATVTTIDEVSWPTKPGG